MTKPENDVNTDVATNKRVFEYEPMPMLCEASGDGVTSKVFALGTIVCVASGGNSGTLSLRCESGASTAKLINRLGAGGMRDVARMLLTAADEMDAMQAMKQKKRIRNDKGRIRPNA